MDPVTARWRQASAAAARAQLGSGTGARLDRGWAVAYEAAALRSLGHQPPMHLSGVEQSVLDGIALGFADAVRGLAATVEEREEVLAFVARWPLDRKIDRPNP